MPGRRIRLMSISGIPVGVSPWWLLIVALITWSLGAGYYPGEVHGITHVQAYALGLASALLLFASILAHEFGHALVARRLGVEIQEIDLWLLGGVARMSGQPKTAEDELRFALAGPGVTAVIAGLFAVVALALPGSAPAALRALLTYQWQVNLLILAFNLVPAFPLDGGRVARALLWRRRGDIASATETAVRVGRGFGYLLIAFGVLMAFSGAPGGLWFALIGGFLVMAAGAERLQERVMTVLTGIPAERLMSPAPVSIPAQATLDEAAEYFSRYRFTAFPVIDSGGRALGLVRIDQLERVPVTTRGTTAVADVMNPDPALLIGRQTDVGHLLEQPAFAKFGRAVVVDDTARPVGVLSLTDIQRAIRASRLGGASDGAGRRASG